MAKYVLLQLGFFVLVGIVSGIVAGINGQPSPATKAVDPVLLIFVNTTAAFLVLRGQLLKSRLSWRDFIRATARWVPLLPAFILIMIGEMVAISETGNVIMAVLPPPQWLRGAFSSINDLAGHPFSGPFVLVVVAAVTEEFLFRGLILRGLLTKTGPVRAIMISALLFAVMHLNPWQMPAAFFLGIVFGWVYLRTRSLALCVFGHGLHNAMNLLAAGLPFTVDGFNRQHAPNVVLFQPWWFNLLGVVALALGTYFFNRAAPVVAWASPVQVVEPPLLPVGSVVADGRGGKV